MNDSESDSEDVEAFFQQLAEEGVMSSAALGQLSDDLKDVRSTEGGMLAKTDVSRLAHTLSTTKEEEPDANDLRAKIADMGLPEKIKLAMLGDATARMLLVSDTNRLVQQAVMNNPRIQDGEVEAIAKNPNVSDFVLRAVSNNRTWMKMYTVKYALATNPKTPQDIGIKWLRFLNKNDLRKIARSKNIPQLIAVTARKRLADMDKRK